MATVDPASKFNLENLRQGGEFKTGENIPVSRGVGWEGALHGLTRVNRPEEYKNLSRQDVAKGAEVLKEKLKSKDDYSGGLDRRDIKDLDHKYETMRQAGDLSVADVKDFKNISSQLKQSSTSNVVEPPAKPASWW